MFVMNAPVCLFMIVIKNGILQALVVILLALINTNFIQDKTNINLKKFIESLFRVWNPVAPRTSIYMYIFMIQSCSPFSEK